MDFTAYFAALLAFGQQGVAPPSAAPTDVGTVQPLALTCAGGGAATKASVGMIGGTGWSANVVTHHDRGFSDQVDVRLFSGDDRIRMPRTMLPRIHGGADGWFKLKNVVADARAIHGSVAVGLLNNPKLYIDRVTGRISISGKSGDYSGDCQVISADAAPKF